MLPLIWGTEALAELEQIITYIAARNPSAADRLGDAIRLTTERLADHPYLHRVGRVPGTREALVHPNYLIVYRVSDVIDILAVLHARQQYP